ncbi:MAG: hypothetical protein OEM41_09730, partial [Ignavibacteria bacterium]|nr:hypothetical protein [Ignavibacteria bacterium]
SQEAVNGLVILFIVIALTSPIMLNEIVPSSLGFLTYVLVLYYALLWFIPYLADRLISNRLKGFRSTLVFPLAGVSLEYFNTIMFGSWGATAYTQDGNLPLLQIMSITGMWGVSFIVLWFGPVVNWAFENGLLSHRPWRGIVIYAGTVCVVLLFGGARLVLRDSNSAAVRIASFTPSDHLAKYYDAIKSNGFSSSIQMALEDRKTLRGLLATMHEGMLEQTRREIRNGAALVLWPEVATRVLQEDEPEFLANASEVARAERANILLAYFVVPLDHPDRQGENKSTLVDSSGQVRWMYLKSHPVPGVTDKEGNGIVPVTTLPFARVGSVICYDMDFTNLILQAGKSNVDILLVPAWDWKAITPLHAVMATFRAIENGFSMVRQTREGLSIAVDPYGRVLASMDYFTAGDQRMTALVPTKGVSTVYSFIGDSFAWVCAGGLLLLIYSGWSPRHKSKLT